MPFIPQDPKTRAAQNSLMSYVRGWKIGASASAYTREMMENTDFARGHQDGRNAKIESYAAACKHYGAELSPLRGE